MLSSIAQRNIMNALTSADLVQTLAYSMFTRPDMNLGKLGFINKMILFSEGTAFDWRSPREWSDVYRYLRKGAVAKQIVVPILQKKRLKSGKVVESLKGYRDSNLFQLQDTYGSEIEYPRFKDGFIDTRPLAEHWNVDLGSLSTGLLVVSYYNTYYPLGICEYQVKRFIYNIVKKAVDVAPFKKQPYKNRIVTELVTLGLLRGTGNVVHTDIDFHKKICIYAQAQNLSLIASYFSVLKACEVVFDTVDLKIDYCF